MSESSPRLGAVTWNLHGCVGGDGRHDVERVGRVIRALAPDLAAFQEVDSRRKSRNREDVDAFLRRQVGDHGHEAWAISGADGHYGQILASRLPLEDRRVHDISVPGCEPRKVVEARVRLAGGPLRVVATHLGLRRGERRRQLTRLRDIVAADLAGPVLLLGDFNEWVPRRPGRRTLFDLLGRPTAHPSFPAWFPLLPLDRIYCRPRRLLARSWAAREARRASDHLPVVAEIDLPAPA